MSQYSFQTNFGTGVLATCRTDVANSTPIQFSALQDVSIDVSCDLKALYGQNKFALALGPGKNKIEVKAKSAMIRGKEFNDLFFGMTALTTNTVQYANNEQDMVPAASTYTITVANAATFLVDWGVSHYLTGQPFQAVASSPTVGQYSVNTATGVYTFAAADASSQVLISYTYTLASGGLIIPISNTLMGAGPSFSMVLNQPFDGRATTWVLNNCKASKLSFPTKQDDFQINELDFMVCADSSGNIGSLTTSIN